MEGGLAHHIVVGESPPYGILFHALSIDYGIHLA